MKNQIKVIYLILGIGCIFVAVLPLCVNFGTNTSQDFLRFIVTSSLAAALIISGRKAK